MTQDTSDISVKEIIHGNRLLAEFLGWELKEEKGKNKHFHYKYWFIDGVKSLGLNQLHFHSNWDLLFKVINKIGNIVFREDNWKEDYSYAELLNKIWNKSDHKYIMNSNITVWYAVVQYIKWHNLNNK